MNPYAVVDLYGAGYWLAVTLGVLLVSPQTRRGPRRITAAMLNLMVLTLLLATSVVTVLAGAVVLWLVLRTLSGRWKSIIWPLAAAALFVLFVLYKRPDLGVMVLSVRTQTVMSAVGFSYVALRLVDASAAIVQGRQPAPDLIGTINYLIPFHMLAAGPIQAYDDFVAAPAIPEPLDTAAALDAIWLIAWGMFKKFVLAYLIEQLFLTGFRAGWPYALLELQLNYIWLYLDFSAYSDVALGVGRLMGIATPVNFNRPYLARNAIDYWERWHISLSQFIRRNIFIPLQLALVRAGVRPLAAASFAFTISFLLCGLWHSIGLPWLAWGALQAAGLVIVNLYRQALLKRLGRKGVNRYLANPWVCAAAVALTFEFEAVCVMVVTLPYQEMSWTIL